MPQTTDYRHTRQDRCLQTELVSTLVKNVTKLNPFEIILLQTTRKENNWKTEETLERAAVTLETERIKRFIQFLMFMMIMNSYSYIYFFFIFLKLGALLWLSCAAGTCSFLDYYNKVLCLDGLYVPMFCARKGRRGLSDSKQ